MSGVAAADWDAFVDEHPSGTPFHKTGWLTALRDVLHKPVHFLTATDAAGRIEGVLPLAVCRSLRDKALVSVPFRDHGGPLARDAAALRRLLQAAKQLAGEVGASRISFQRTDPGDTEILEAQGFAPQARGVDSVIDLAMPEEEYWSGLRSKVRQDLRKARKAGVKVGWEEGSAALRDLFKAHVVTRHRLGVACYPWKLFRSLVEDHAAAAKMLIARAPDGRVGAGLIIYIYASRAYPVLFGYRPEYGEVRLVDSLFYEAIRACRAAGARSFLFGTDSPRQESLLEYKAKWLAQPQEVCSRHWTRGGRIPAHLDTESAGFRWVRAALAQAPSPLFRIASRMSLALWE